jgi:ADP-heptose:LPS heptosyltransferase
MISGPILVVKLADLGDAVLSLPAIQALRDRYPDQRIDVLTTPAAAQVFSLSPPVSDVITLAKQRYDHVRGLISPAGIFDLAKLTVTLRRRRYAAVVILHHLTTSFGTHKFRSLARASGAPVVAGLDNGRGDFLTHRAVDFGFGARTEWEYALVVAQTLDASGNPQRPRLEVPDSACTAIDQLFAQKDLPPRYAVVHPEVGEFSSAREWPGDRFIEVGRELSEEINLGVVFVGSNRDSDLESEIRKIPSAINLSGRTTFAELCAIVRRAELVIGCDSAVTHLGATFERPVVALFGPSNVGAWKPYGATEYVPTSDFHLDSRTVALHLNLPCSPCLYTGFRLGRPHGCPLRTCMMEIQTEHVVGAVRSILSP